MIELSQAKQIINYIAPRGLCETYDVFPFCEVNEVTAAAFEALQAQYPSCDALVEDLRRQHRMIGTHLKVKKEKTTALLRNTGYMVDVESESPSFFCGREKELLKIKIALNKKIKNNVLLVGNPGTGKTKLVEAFAKQNQIHNVFVVECAKLVGSTEYRGAFEQRTVDLLNYVKRYGLIVFFDEIHALINLGKSTGGMSITDILKPYLLDEAVVFIGATTPREMHIFSEDEAFKRRFSMIRLNEPEEEMLISIKCSLERNVFMEEILTNSDTTAVIERLREALPKMFFPDKLIDFLDYLYSYRNTVQTDVAVDDILDEFIEDNKSCSE